MRGGECSGKVSIAVESQPALKEAGSLRVFLVGKKVYGRLKMRVDGDRLPRG